MTEIFHLYLHHNSYFKVFRETGIKKRQKKPSYFLAYLMIRNSFYLPICQVNRTRSIIFCWQSTSSRRWVQLLLAKVCKRGRVNFNKELIRIFLWYIQAYYWWKWYFNTSHFLFFFIQCHDDRSIPQLKLIYEFPVEREIYIILVYSFINVIYSTYLITTSAFLNYLQWKLDALRSVTLACWFVYYWSFCAC